MLKEFKDKGVGSVQSLIMLYKDKKRINTYGNKLNFLGIGKVQGLGRTLKEVKLPYEIDYSSGACCAYRVSVLKEIGFFDEYFFCYHEDLDLGYRIRKAGFKNVLAKDSIVYHDYEFKKNKNKFFFIERNRLIFLFSIYPWYFYILLFPFIIFSEILILIYATFKGFLKEKLKAYRAFLKSFPHVRKRRKLILS